MTLRLNTPADFTDDQRVTLERVCRSAMSSFDVALATVRVVNEPLVHGRSNAWAIARRSKYEIVLSRHGFENRFADLVNITRHEFGHLAGLDHCSTPGCLMQPLRSRDDVAARADQPCGACPRAIPHSTWLIVAVLILLAL